jgi:hypothetical protein
VIERWFGAAAIAALLAPAAVGAAGTVPREHEGEWYFSDTTDNNTGERQVYAMVLHVASGDPDFVQVYMRCSAGKPTFWIDWSNLDFPDQAVVSVFAEGGPKGEPADQSYVFEKSTDPVESGLRASPETSARIVAAIATSSLVTISAHLAPGPRSVVINVDGAQRAWDRVSRHCPVQKLPVPPL